EVKKVVEAAKAGKAAKAVKKLKPAFQELGKIVEASNIGKTTKIAEKLKPAMQKTSEVVKNLKPAIQEAKKVVKAVKAGKPAKAAKKLRPALHEAGKALNELKPLKKIIKQITSEETLSTKMVQDLFKRIARDLNKQVLRFLTITPNKNRKKLAVKSVTAADVLASDNTSTNVPLIADAVKSSAFAEVIETANKNASTNTDTAESFERAASQSIQPVYEPVPEFTAEVFEEAASQLMESQEILGQDADSESEDTITMLSGQSIAASMFDEEDGWIDLGNEDKHTDVANSTTI
ncbi:MAG: hypothetical protein VXZ73_01805, partial [Pseudomonadota bacterium]|nr:hypothetical protein [Pseudomonadota bacterium]